MIESITLKNFRTHVSTTINLGPITLLIGPNGAGKSNLLYGINFFSRLIAYSRPNINNSNQKEPAEGYYIKAYDFLNNRHLPENDEPMEFSCVWSLNGGKIQYIIQLYENKNLQYKVGVREEISITPKNEAKQITIKSGWDEKSNLILLRSKLRKENLIPSYNELAEKFFRDITGCFVYNFQPTFLKGRESRNENKKNQDESEQIRIASYIGYEGGNLQKLLRYTQINEPQTYNKFIAALRRFEPSFHGIDFDQNKNQTVWLFDLGRNPAKPDPFPPEVVSDGLLKAAAVALISSMRYSPALMLLEEIENGVNQKNLARFLGWMYQATGNHHIKTQEHSTQFIITSHSPGVLREFSSNLENVYYVRLQRKGYKSMLSDLNSSLAVLINIGNVEGECEEEDGKQIIKISPDKLTELWFSGVIGGVE